MYDIIIIGCGASGGSAALFAARNRLKTLVIDKGPSFGALGAASSVSDFPGFPENISGTDLISKIKKQAETFGAEIKTTTATSCTLTENSKRITTNEPVTYETKTILCATGNMSQPNTHTYQGERELIGKGVSHDVEADAPACKHAAVAIIGKSNSTAEAAIHLSKYAEKVFWVIPASKIDLPDNLKDELDKIKRIESFFSSSLKKINGTNEVSSVTMLYAGQDKHLNVKYVFLPPQQHKPITDYLGGTGVQLNTDGCIMVNQQMETSIPGIFAAGNILCTKPQLNVVCAAQGAIAALNVEKYLRK